jgi:NADPH:quinone reductase-like Zn-dependent oxidoreductase
MFPGEVLVNLQAAALNHIDVWTRLEVTGMALPMPPILGADAAGIVIQAATGIKGLSTDDNVCVLSVYRLR